MYSKKLQLALLSMCCSCHIGGKPYIAASAASATRATGLAIAYRSPAQEPAVNNGRCYIHTQQYPSSCYTTVQCCGGSWSRRAVSKAPL